MSAEVTAKLEELERKLQETYDGLMATGMNELRSGIASLGQHGFHDELKQLANHLNEVRGIWVEEK